MSKLFLNINVYEAFNKRLDVVFNDFDNVVVAFSGGKDSGVLLNLCLRYLDQHRLDRKLGVLHLDYEAQYTATTEYVDQVFAYLAGKADLYRCCVPFKGTTCTSMSQDYWRPWDPDKQQLWVRQMPDNCMTKDDFPFYRDDMWDYEFQELLSRWLAKQHRPARTCVLIGIRAQESLDRWRTITSSRNINKYKKQPWTTAVSPVLVKAYPLYDWITEDVWTANAHFGFSYNKLYDLLHLAGVPLHAQRVASPFHSAAKSSLSMYRAIDPDVWGKLVSRVNGVNFTAMYGGTKAMGWKSIGKPAHFTWKEYMMFLLDTLPAETAASYRSKLETSIDFWQKRGGVLPPEAIADLRSAGLIFKIGGKTNYKTDKLPVTMEYADDIESQFFSLIPTYKRMCICIMKNDHLCKYMGFSLNKREMARRKAALEKYKNI